MSSPPPASPTLPTTTPSDLAAATALSSLTSHSSDPDPELSTSSNAADTAALGAAVSNLSLSDKNPTKVGSGQSEAVAEVRKAVKIDQVDVGFLVEELDLSKTKATELLRANGGDRIATLRAFIAPVRTVQRTGVFT